MRILAYVEPHPIRNSHSQFGYVGRVFAQALLSASRRERLEFRIFANDAVAGDVSSEYPEVIPWLMRPTPREAAAIRPYDQTWDEQTIDIWLQLVNGQGSVTALYVSLLRRLHDTFPFDVVLLWAENGAVEQAARELGATAVRAELGPTRLPFPPTIYLDARGTNGNASVIRVPSSVVESTTSVPEETWLTPSSRSPGAGPGVIESCVLWPSAAVAALLPRDPYVFVPMQLADDLNTRCHSTCRSPAEFLELVIPGYLEQGLRVVVKGHPGVAARPHNLSMERRALAKVRAMGDRVVVLPNAITSSDTLAVVAQSHAVCTINSSMGFESMLLGKRTALLGAAVYDLRGRIRERGVRMGRTEEERRWDNLLVCFLMGHYLLPLSDVLSGEALLAAIRLIRGEHLRRGEFGEGFWSEWVRHMRFGWRDLVQDEPGAREMRGSSAVLGSGLTHVIGGELRSAGDSVDVCLRSLASTCVFSVARVERCFTGHVDELEWKGGTCRMRGWAFDARHEGAAAALIVASAETIVVCRRICEARPDVAEHLRNAALERSGFEVVFSTELPRSSLRLFVVSERSGIQEIAWRTGPLSA